MPLPVIVPAADAPAVMTPRKPSPGLRLYGTWSSLSETIAESVPTVPGRLVYAQNATDCVATS